MPRITLLSVLGLSLASAGFAQTYNVIPAGFGYDKKPGALGMATPWWADKETRRVDVFSAAGMGFNAGVLKELAFRNYAPSAQQAKTSTVTIWMGMTKADPGQLPPKFSMLNIQRRTQVFQGTVNLPQTTANVQNWFPIKLKTPFLYANATDSFVIEMQGKSASTTYWSMDATQHPTDWTNPLWLRLGRGCKGTQTTTDMLQSMRTPHIATPGGHINGAVIGANTTSKTLIHLIGVNNKSPFPIDLTGVGAPGCKLYASIDLQLGLPTCCASPAYNRGLWAIPIPNQSQFAGAKLNSQMVDLDKAANRLGLVVSDGMEITIGAKGTFVYKGAGAWVYGIGNYGLIDWHDSYSNREYVTIYRLTL